MIRLSANIQARRRDLAILEAARSHVENIPFAEHLIVHPADWPGLKTMPRRHAVLYPELAFDAPAMEQIGRGFVMHDMDAKWFIHLDGDRIKLHRSWTGILVFDAGFAFDAGGGTRVSDLLVNRDPARYNTSSGAEDLELFMNVIRWYLLEPRDWK